MHSSAASSNALTISRGRTIGTLTSLYASLFSFQAHIAAHTTEPQLVLIDTRIHSLSLPLQHSRPSQNDLIMSAWTASLQHCFDWLGSISIDTTDDAETHTQHALTWTPSRTAQVPKMYAFQPTVRPSTELGLYSRLSLHSWRASS